MLYFIAFFFKLLYNYFGVFMNNDKISEFIKKIRKDNHLTQKELANKYNVTYQAVSKWENGKNIPDISLLIKMSKDYNIDLSDILNININKYDNKINKKKYILIIMMIIVIISLIFVIIILNRNSSFEFKTIESSCNDFQVYGSLAYSKNKSSIYISNINYCGNDDYTTYQELNCSLYEKSNDTIKEISKCELKNNITLEEYLKNISFNIENFNKKCKNYTKDSLYLEINAKIEDNIKTYKIPLNIESCDK